MSPTLIYIHSQYGSPEEAEHYRALFPGCEVIGFDYKAQTPWEAEREFAEYFDGMAERMGGSIGIIANSIGAFYAMCALSGRDIAAAYFISPIVDMERIEGVTLDEEHRLHAHCDARRRALVPHRGADGNPGRMDNKLYEMFVIANNYSYFCAQ